MTNLSKQFANKLRAKLFPFQFFQTVDWDGNGDKKERNKPPIEDYQNYIENGDLSPEAKVRAIKMMEIDYPPKIEELWSRFLAKKRKDKLMDKKDVQ